LQHWIENVFSRLVVQVLHVLGPSEGESSRPDSLSVTLADVEKWQEMGVARLGALRIRELFDVVVEWDGSKGAIEDLKHYVSFHSTLMARLLHPGASTVEILKVYVSIIRAFAELDPRGVLLEKVARPIRRYLKGRDDTVKVIVGGLLSEHTDREGQDPGSEIEQLPELARELSDAHQLALRDAGEELDWDDMNWMPDPVDAALDYKKSKTDVIGSLISLFDTREVFVKELQQALSERLLKRSREYDQETSVLELLKIRFGDSSLQACEVMLRDIVDSKRVDSFICAEQKAGPKGDKEAPSIQEVKTHRKGPEIHAKILSRLYWPSLQEMAFTIPEEVAMVQQKYSVGFEALKPSRKLTWLNGLGRVKVELDLEDRVFQDEVTTWQATVIYAFQSPSPMSDLPVIKTVTEVAEQLSMSTSFVRSACLFWLSKQVLTETHPDTFQVLERLPRDSDDADPRLGASNTPSSAQHHHHHTPHRRGSISHTAAAAAAAAAQAAEAVAKESATSEALAKMDLYWQFIVGMLTNQGAMPLQRIIMMLKMVVPGGFPFSSEEVKEFLGQRVAQGKLEIVGGGNYKIVK
jgi:anaphase-promoting complex subunit 2